MLTCAVILGMLSLPAIAEDETVYLHKFSDSLNCRWGGAPDTVEYSKDGAVTFKSTTYSNQKQCNYNVDTSMATQAIEAAKQGSGMVAFTVTMGECKRVGEVDCNANVILRLQFEDGTQLSSNTWQGSNSTMEYTIDVRSVTSTLKYVYVCVQNYAVDGIIQNTTFSPVYVYVPVDTSDYFLTFSESNRYGYGNAPDLVTFSDDGSCTFKNATVSNQKQCYFGVDKTIAQTALDKIHNDNTNKVYCTVRIDSCVDSSGKDASVVVKLWLDTTGAESSDPAITQWQAPGTTVTYELDLTNITSDVIQGFYIGAMNYSISGGVAPNLTFSPIMTIVPTLSEPGADTGGYLIEETDSGECIITDYIGTDAELVIPECFGELTVTAIGESAFAYNNNITSLTVPDTVKTIGKEAFRKCEKLKTVYLGKSVTDIGKAAFADCTALSDVEVTSELKELPNQIFSNCTSLKGITLPRSIENIGVFAFDNVNELTVKGWRMTDVRDYAVLNNFGFEPINSGDANGDGAVNGKDVLALRKYIVGLTNEINEDACDINSDYKLNGKDVLQMRKLIIGLAIENDITPFDNSLSDIDKIKQTYSLVWADEFNGDELDESVWNYEGSGTHRNAELQVYCDNADEGNVYMEDGCCVIEARKESRHGYDYTSGSITTFGTKQFKYGVMEINAILPKGQGVWPAFWMLGVNPATGVSNWPATGELDIMELVGGGINDSTTHGTAHATDAQNKHISKGGSYILPKGTFNDDFHLIGVLWTETDIYWYIDDTVYFSVDTTDPDYMCYNKYEFYFILNLAIGGSWPGNPADSTEFPSKYYIDYIRVYQ